MALTPTVVRKYDNDAPPPDETETATFGLGCFWGPEAEFAALAGVIRTRVGYAGGTKSDPTYHTLGDHTEVFQLDYDPDVISYTDLLDEVFTSHNPRKQTAKRQYQNLTLTATDEQQEQVEAFLASSMYDRDTIETRIEPLSQFYVAEAYHQKYNLKGKGWVTEVFDDLEYSDEQLRESPAAAVLNAHLSGYDVSAPFISTPTER